LRFAIVVGRFYEDLADRLVTSTTRVFEEAGAEAVDVFDVPGAFELPMAAQLCAQTGRFDGIAALGAVIRGETSHYDIVCNESARGIQEVQLRTGVPCAYGVLTVDRHDGPGAGPLRRRETGLWRARRGGRPGARSPAFSATLTDVVGLPLGISGVAEISALVLTFLVHVAGAFFLIRELLGDDGWDGLRGWWPRDDQPDDGPRDPAPRRPTGDLPLPTAQPSPVRLREPARVGGAHPRPARRPEHAPEPARRPGAPV
jgi:6,7-dimethyl-8-ribityllumazine synthase